MSSPKVFLIEILKHISEYDWNKSIYCVNNEYSTTTACKVLTMEEAVNDVENKDMHHVLSISQAQDIVSNLSQQIEKPTEQELLEAFKYYIENDGYILK